MFTWQKLLMQQVAAAASPTGQVVLLAGTTSWTVPAGVTSICVVAVQGGATGISGPAGTSITVSGTIVCRAANFSRIGDGGGDGGPGGNGYSDAENFFLPGGGGGAGGYAGNGGQGGSQADGSNGQAGSGGGGGGGKYLTGGASYPGGGVGLLGQGTSGAAQTGAGAGNPGSGGSGVTYGGGAAGGPESLTGGYGGALSYKNNISVTPGQVITISIPSTLSGAGASAVRIIWGAGRSFPSTNTGDM